jgi:Transcription factor WhiB
MYATINEDRIALTSDIAIDFDIDQTFNALVAPVEVRAPQARCADGNGTLTHLFFSDDALSTARAKAICGKCKLAESCLEGAIARAEPWGVWGGELVENGRIVANKRPRGRPPKHPRPIVPIDEVPIPPHLVA